MLSTRWHTSLRTASFKRVQLGLRNGQSVLQLCLLVVLGCFGPQLCCFSHCKVSKFLYQHRFSSCLAGDVPLEPFKFLGRSFCLRLVCDHLRPQRCELRVQLSFSLRNWAFAAQLDS